jgi:Fe-S cluster biosynthesis and repair protein YggX
MESNIDNRIAQWEKMAAEAPDDMAYFSLGSAYQDAGRLEDAAEAYDQAIQRNDGLSRAYQKRGEVLHKLDRPDEAGDVLEAGYRVATSRGDVMPQRSIAALLQRLDRPLPDVSDLKPEVPDDEPIEGEAILDRRTGRKQPKLAGPPMKGPVGQFIYDHFGQQTWSEWIGQGTKVINELRLDFSNPAHQDTYEQQMLDWLGVSQDEIDEHAASSAAT